MSGYQLTRGGGQSHRTPDQVLRTGDSRVCGVLQINQAYFAFHGIYADRPGASGSDPIGPRLLELRYYSDSLYDFVRTIRTITSTEDMLTALEREKQ